MRHGEAQCICSLEIDHQLEFRRLLHRQIGGVLAPENPSVAQCQCRDLLAPARQERIGGTGLASGGCITLPDYVEKLRRPSIKQSARNCCCDNFGYLDALN